MIPKNIKGEHIIRAIEEIIKRGVPKGRNSKKFHLEHNGNLYPPKYIISLASKYATGEELDPSVFGAGKETNGFLENLGFNIVRKLSSEKPVIDAYNKKDRIKISKTRHDERCSECKETILKLLEKIYGKVEPNYKFEMGAHLEDFKHTPYYDKLKEIYKALQNHRGFKEFVRAKKLPHCDFFVPNPGFIVEFDESQHFTLPRKIALTQYPEKFELGFNRERWIILCEKINAKDNDPVFRDEQRAWYDTLRDFLPEIKGLKGTVRLFARDFEWCKFDPNNPLNVKKFKSLLKTELGKWQIEVREEPAPFFARVVIADDWKGDQEKARKTLEYVYKKWPQGKKVKFLITCGGFIQFDWPSSISKKDIGDNRFPNSNLVETLVIEAEKCAKFVISEGLGNRLRELTDYITLGIDSYKEKISTTQNYIGQPHIELVLLIDLRNNKFYWTGKSYPTSNQQNGLVRISELKKHFFELDDVGNVMILGCHDLTIFNPRSKNAKGWRRKVNEEFKRLSKEFEPSLVLHHPHTTDSIRTWAAAWSGLKKELPIVKIYASAGRYYNSKGERSKLEDILEKTKCGNAIEFIVWALND